MVIKMIIKGEWYKFWDINVRILKIDVTIGDDHYCEVIDEKGNMGAVNKNDLKPLDGD
jgi:hypothetical protein